MPSRPAPVGSELPTVGDDLAGRRFRRLLAVIAALAAAVGCFATLQNAGVMVGGEISTPKVLWLLLAITSFIVVPMAWWRWSSTAWPVRAAAGIIGISFVVRALIELPMLYLTTAWDTSMGVAHDIAVVALAGGILAWGHGRGAVRTAADVRGSALMATVLALLVAEAGFAYAFGGVADPSTGVYFASTAAQFNAINAATWAVVIAGYSGLSAALLVSRRDLGWTTAARGDRRRLSTTILAPSDFADLHIERAWEIFDTTYDNADRSRFVEDLLAKTWVIAIFDTSTDTLRGFSTAEVTRISTPRGVATILFSGDTAIEQGWWGQKALQWGFVKVMLRARGRRLRGRLYWLLLSKGFKTYLLMTNYFPRSTPRRGDAPTGELDEVLSSVASARFGTRYDPSTGIVRAAGGEFVRAGTGDAAVPDPSHPDVAFFLQANQHWARGDELACLAWLRWRDLLYTPLRIASRYGRRPNREHGGRGAGTAAAGRVRVGEPG